MMLKSTINFPEILRTIRLIVSDCFPKIRRVGPTIRGAPDDDLQQPTAEGGQRDAEVDLSRFLLFEKIEWSTEVDNVSSR